jgi:hypothetical protein
VHLTWGILGPTRGRPDPASAALDG